MNKKNITLSVVVSIVSILVVIIITATYVKNNKEDKQVQAALFASEIVKNSFNKIENNKHMNLDETLASLVNTDDINLARFAKHESFDKDSKNIISKKLQYKVTDNKMEISIPISAQWTTSNDCTKCHNITYGQNIGTLELQMHLGGKTSLIVYILPLIVLFTIMFILYLSVKSKKDNTLLFEKLSKSLNSALNGKYKKINSSNHLSSNSLVVVDKYNQLIGTFEETSNYIDKRLKGFVGVDNNDKNITPLDETKNIISNLSNLYQFKKEIEQDNSNEEIFNRISEIFINKYKLKNFNFVEVNNATNKIKVLKEQGDCFHCGSHITDDPSLCRAARTSNDVVSIDYHHSCPYFKNENRFHYCISTNIIKDIHLIVNFVFDTKEELDSLKSKISVIKSYINESIPSIEVKLLMNALQESAYVDGLTGLYNRKFLDAEMQKLIPLAKRENFDIGVLLLDMDHFKAVNDEYGHDIGDKVLKELASIIDETVRESDIAVRYGGEEFLVLLVNVKSEDNARKIADKIRVKVSEREIDVYAGSKLRKTISVGLSMYPQDSSNIDGVIKNADIALYEAKSKGRNQVIRFNEEQVSSVDLF